MKRKAITVGLVLALGFGVVITRAIWEGRSALARGDSAHRSGDEEGAVTWWRRAARWYVPLAPHVSSAYDRLEGLARAAEAQGDTTTALAAWRGIRGSVLSTRSFYTPHRDRLDLANRKIAGLMAATEGAKVAPGQSVEERTRWHHELLARDEAPSVFWSIIALIGFAVWIGGGVLMAVRGVSSEDRLQARTAAYAGAMVAVGLFIWMVGLYNA